MESAGLGYCSFIAMSMKAAGTGYGLDSILVALSAENR
jgi:hypothetical protein